MRSRKGVVLAAGLTSLIALVAAAAVPSVRWFRGESCLSAVEERRFSDAVDACREAFDSTGKAEYAASLAMALVAVGQIDEAWRWANAPEAEGQVRALRIKGVVLRIRGQLDLARETLTAALEAALKEGAASEAARAAHALAGLYWTQGAYSAAYDAIEVSEREASRAGDGPALALAEIARGDIFRYLGDAQRADVSYRRAIEASADWPADLAYAHFKTGVLHQERRTLGLAREHLERSLALSESTRNQDLIFAARHNLARVLLLEGKLDEAQRQVRTTTDDELSKLPRDAQATIPLLRAEIALGRGEIEQALTQLERARRASGELQLHWEVATVRGDALKAAGRIEEAEKAWGEAIDAIDALTLKEPQHQGWVVSRRRKPFDALFSSLVRRGEHQAAWNVLARYSLSEALSFTGNDGNEVDDPRKLVESAEALKANWPLKGDTVEAAVPSISDSEEVLVLHETPDRLWIGTRRGRRVKFVDAGSREDLDPLLHRFLGDGGDAEAAARLGEALWDAAGLSSSDERLHIYATGRLHRLALAALRHKDRYWVELRPIARLPSLSAPAREVSTFFGAPLIAGDPKGDLSAAREEVAWVASRLNAPSLSGAAVTREAVISAKGRSLLHLATHATIGLEGARLVLADGELSAQEVLVERPHARLVVLASCASGMGREAAGSDSLSTAFLRAGSGAVVSTLRSVPDEAAQQFVRAFYAHGGERDPVAGITRAQRELVSRLPAAVWSAFVVTVGPSLR